MSCKLGEPAFSSRKYSARNPHGERYNAGVLSAFLKWSDSSLGRTTASTGTPYGRRALRIRCDLSNGVAVLRFFCTDELECQRCAPSAQETALRCVQIDRVYCVDYHEIPSITCRSRHCPASNNRLGWMTSTCRPHNPSSRMSYTRIVVADCRRNRSEDVCEMSCSQLNAADYLGTVSTNIQFQASSGIKSELGDWELWSCEVSTRVPPLGTKLPHAAAAQPTAAPFSGGGTKKILSWQDVFD